MWPPICPCRCIGAAFPLRSGPDLREAVERQRAWQEQRIQNMHMQQPQPISVDVSGLPIDVSGNYTLPAALLAQYPALATLSWPEIPQDDAGIERKNQL